MCFVLVCVCVCVCIMYLCIAQTAAVPCARNSRSSSAASSSSSCRRVNVCAVNNKVISCVKELRSRRRVMSGTLSPLAVTLLTGLSPMSLPLPSASALTEQNEVTTEGEYDVIQDDALGFSFLKPDGWSLKSKAGADVLYQRSDIPSTTAGLNTYSFYFIFGIIIFCLPYYHPALNAFLNLWLSINYCIVIYAHICVVASILK